MADSGTPFGSQATCLWREVFPHHLISGRTLGPFPTSRLLSCDLDVPFFSYYVFLLFIYFGNHNYFFLLFKVIHGLLHPLELHFMEKRALSLLFINIFLLPRMGPSKWGNRRVDICECLLWTRHGSESVTLDHVARTSQCGRCDHCTVIQEKDWWADRSPAENVCW